MLQHPRHPFQVLRFTPSIPTFPQSSQYSHRDLVTSSWEKTKARLVAKWISRQSRRIKRGVVRGLATTRASANRSTQSESTRLSRGGYSFVESKNSTSDTGTSAAQFAALCHKDLRASKFNAVSVLKDLNLVGNSSGNIPHYKLQRPELIGSMEKKQSARAAQRSSNCQPKQNGQRGQSPEQYVAIKKKEAVDKVMAAFNEWLDKGLAIISHAYESGRDVRDVFNGSSDQGSGDSKPGRSSRRAKRQFDGDDRDNSSSGGGEENGQDRGGNKRAKKDDPAQRMFACPYFQHDPASHNRQRSCTGPGWSTIHRLKEHLYRIHKLPKHTCPRCQEPMHDAKDLEDHLRSDTPCAKRDLVRVQGIDEAQEKKLRERKKTSAIVNEEQKWREIYMILFPNANKHALPSPYYDSKDSTAFAKSAAEFKKFKKHVQKELPKAVQKRVERKFEGVAVELLDGLGDIVRDEIFQIFKGMPHARSSESPPDSPRATPRSSTPKSLPVTQSDIAKDSIDMSLYLNDYEDVHAAMLVNFSDYYFGQQSNFDSAFECQVPDKESDSGYASTSTTRDNFPIDFELSCTGT